MAIVSKNYLGSNLPSSIFFVCFYIGHVSLFHKYEQKNHNTKYLFKHWWLCVGGGGGTNTVLTTVDYLIIRCLVTFFWDIESSLLLRYRLTSTILNLSKAIELSSMVLLET